MKKGSIYELEGRVQLKEAVPLGIQHVLAMFLGNVSPLNTKCNVYIRYCNINSIISKI